MADVAEELGLGTINLGQCFGTLALFLVSPGISNGGRDLSGYQITEPAVAIIKTQP